jgi:hypothetical protein
MKKVIFISALAIAAAVSCTKSDIVDTKFNEAISFENYIGRDAMTKAAVTNNENITDFTIGLYGYYTGAKPWKIGEHAQTADAIAEPSANLWDGDALAYDETKGWYTEETKYWTNASDYYSFLAYAPMVSTEGADGITVTGTAANDVNVTYTTPVANDKLTTNVDLLYAQVVNTTKGSGTVTLNFKHALSRVTVKAKASDPKNMGIQFDVKNVTLKGYFNTSATLNLATAAAAVGATEDSGWDVENATRTNAFYVFYNDIDTEGDFNPAAIGTDGKATDALTAEAVDYAVEADEDYLMMIPTTFTTDEGETAILSVTYTTIYGGNESNPMTKELPIAIDFRMGKAYALELAFEPVLDVISFNVTVEEWQPTTGGVTDEIEEPAGNPETSGKDGSKWEDVTE